MNIGSEWLVGIFGALASVILWLLKMENISQEKRFKLYTDANTALITEHVTKDDLTHEAISKTIRLLQEGQEAGAAGLTRLQLEIAREHYVKRELDDRFAHLDETFRDGFNQLGMKFDRLTEMLINQTAGHRSETS